MKPSRTTVALRVLAAFGLGLALTGLAAPQLRFLWSSFVHAGL